MEKNNVEYIEKLKKIEKFNIEKKMIEKNKSNIIDELYRLALKVKYFRFNIKYQSTIQVHPEFNQNIDDWINSLSKDIGNSRVAVYTCILGNYDSLIEPSFIHSNIDYFVYSDKYIESENWQFKIIPEKIKEIGNPILINRYIKLHPYEFFSEYDYILYIDGNIEITSDITGLINNLSEYGIAMHKHFERKSVYNEAKALYLLKKGNKEKIAKQINYYHKKGFPKNFGLAEATIILSSPNSKYSKKIFDLWWEEFLTSESYRDQLAFPYIMWKNGLDINKVTTLGENLRKSGKFIMHQHNR